ncbi:hypothetical protein ABT278_16525 [Streptomyces sp. NPDC001228]|uniref:hypothetical protein n=1 Tax=Streptomyces sp. NPDC001228 TaxID=3154381 RepID=UPI0033210782
MSGFDEWLAGFADDEGALGDLARLVVTDPNGPPAEGTCESLAAATESGSRDSLVAEPKRVALSADQRARATTVRRALKSELPRPDGHYGGRYARATAAGLVCHDDAAAAARWLREAGFARVVPVTPAVACSPRPAI